MNSAECRKIHMARRAAAVDLGVFNEWLKKEHGCALAKVVVEKFDEVMAAVREMGGIVEEPKATTEAEMPAPVSEPAPTPVLAPKTSDEPKSETIKKTRICFSFTDVWHVRRLMPLMNGLNAITNDYFCYYWIHFNAIPDRMTDQENRTMAALRETFVNWDGTSRAVKYGLDVLVVDDPTRVEHDKIKARHRIGVQPSLIKNHGAISRAIPRLRKYCCWSKEDKNRLKDTGTHGRDILVIGSVWLSELDRLRREGALIVQPIAALYAPANNAPCRAFWKSNCLLEAIAKMKYEIIVIRNGRKDPNWLPPDCKVYDDVDVNMKYIPKLVVAPHGLPLPEAAAMEIPVLRLNLGQVVDPRELMSATPEKYSGEMINPDASLKVAELIEGMMNAK